MLWLDSNYPPNKDMDMVLSFCFISFSFFYLVSQITRPDVSEMLACILMAERL